MSRFAVLLTLLVPILASAPVFAGEPPAMTVWKSPWCGCCGAWIEHMQAAGFAVQVREMEDLSVVKRTAGVPEALESCHTARVGDYTIEGHVPAADVARLLAERPDAVGLAVPGMPAGSPGMETGGQDPYDVILMTRDGAGEVYSSYR